MAYSISKDCIGCTACQTLCPVHAISGEKKALHRIDPGACIQCGACGRICPSNAVSDYFGLTLTNVPRKHWPKPQFNLDLCMSCTICLETCPVQVIDQSLQRVGSCHPFPFLADEKGCLGCGFCSQDCPVDAIEMIVAQDPKQASKAPEESAA